MSNTTLAEIRQTRLDKAATLRAKGLNPYPSTSRRSHYAQAVLDSFATLEGQEVTVAGRLMSLRDQGALAFAHLQDQSGRLQLFLRKNLVAPTDAATGCLGFADLHLADLGDIVEATGKVMRTQRGEISVLVESLRLLTKAIRPLPDQWSGLKDREQVLRKRYLDTTLEPASRDRFALVARMVAAIRTFLAGRGFLEFNTPVIQPQYGGGTAKPFKTHVNALGVDMYLAISHELYLKRLIAAGYDKVFTIGRYFRNEGIDRSHHPEFSMVETMTAYENYEYNMQLVEDLFRHVAVEVFGRTTFTVKGHTVDFAAPWRRLRMVEAVKERCGIDFAAAASTDDANAHLATLGIAEPQPSPGHALVKAFEVLVEPTLVQPTLILGHPIEISPLAKPMADDPRFVERFEIFIGGMECGDNWSEQNDPAQLLETWRHAYREAERDEGRFHTLDFDFIECLEYGLPPTTGIGPGVERMAMIFCEQENIDDVIFFPLMRPVVTPINAQLYGIEKAPDPAPVDWSGAATVTLDECKRLCRDGALAPRVSNLIVRPHVRMWSAIAPSAVIRFTAHADIEGFLPHGTLRVTGLHLPHDTNEPQTAAAELTEFLNTQFPGASVTVELPAQPPAPPTAPPQIDPVNP
ncbi:MAG: lysine--tRNA ligase [Verrucomicrobiae bacterium]|nr:lysine--tRNA ligase [Verrucomicrobiae bacterium]